MQKKATALIIEENDINFAQLSKDLRCILGSQKKKLKIPFFDHIDTHVVSEKIREYFTEICMNFPPLDYSQLPNFLPTSNQISVYKSLKDLMIRNVFLVGSLLKRLIKEFVYEISLPLTYVYNLCLNSGTFSSRWKQVTITALPKKKVITPLRDLCPLSLR